MRNFFWMLLSMGAGLALLSSRPDKASAFCDHCGSASLPDFSNYLSAPVKITLPYPAPPAPEDWRLLPPAQRLEDARARLLPALTGELARQKARLGNAAYIRIFKESSELELWLKTGTDWKLFRTYPIATFSGTLGPKLVEGDGQAPEGFYSANQASLNPGSTFHLSFNIGYPNAYDRHHGRTGSFIMVHGAEVSIGCFAMTDPVIEEIYLLVEAALEKGQSEVPVHIFPFRMTEERVARAKDETWSAFWNELKPAYDAFDKHRTPPKVGMKDGKYMIQSGG